MLTITIVIAVITPIQLFIQVVVYEFKSMLVSKLLLTVYKCNQSQYSTVHSKRRK